MPKLISIPEDLQGVTRFNVEISEVEPINDLFSKCFVKILYPGLNRNNVFIEKEVANEMANTLYNIPIVGEFLETIEDFKDHGGKIEITSDDIKFIQTTKPYGFVPEGTEIGWQNVVEADGTTNEYLTCVGYLWTGRYPEVANVISEGRPQSMELDEETLEGYWQQEGGNTFFHITKAKFSALCILGKDVPPAFESANIGSYYVSNPIAFTKQLGKLIRNLEESLLEEEDKKVVNFSSTQDNKEQKTNEGGSNMLQFNLNLDEDNIKYKIYDKLNPMIEEQREWKYSIVKVDIDSAKFTYVDEATDKTFLQEYEMKDDSLEFVGEAQEIEMTEKDDKEMEELKDNYKQLQADYELLKTTQKNENLDDNELQEKITNLETENQTLKEFKATTEKKEKEEIITKFTNMLSEEDINPIKENIDNYTADELEKELAATAFKKIDFTKYNNNDDFIPNSDNVNDDVPGWVKIVKKHQTDE